MARSKGSFGLAGAVEPKAAAPLDARAVVKNMGELTAVGSFPYPYIGMETYVVSEGKKYRLIGNDPTVSSNWEEVGGGTGGGHTIEDPEGTALTQRDTLQFGGDLEVSDDDENEKTVVAPHELTVAELAEIVTPLPSVPVNIPILFDETGAERIVGWYKLANGTKKPVYQRSFTGTISFTNSIYNFAHNIANVSECLMRVGYVKESSIQFIPFGFANLSSSNYYWIDAFVNTTTISIRGSSNYNAKPFIITIQYTKNTDTPT